MLACLTISTKDSFFFDFFRAGDASFHSEESASPLRINQLTLHTSGQEPLTKICVIGPRYSQDHQEGRGGCGKNCSDPHNLKRRR